MKRALSRLDALCRAARPTLDAGGFDLEVALGKARLCARIVGADGDASVELGRFDVLGWLGRGGMGTVFEARDRRDGTRLALKTLHIATSGDGTEDALTRLKREFRSLADISHRNLVTMYELHVDRGLPFFTMELIEGRSLHELLHDPDPLSDAWLRSVLLQVVDALATLHAHGTAHGDIKPANVMLSADGKVTLLDFGVARALTERPRLEAGSGTPDYMAPERLRGGEVSPAWDYFSLGALLREILAHALAGPFHARLQALCVGLLDPDVRTRLRTSDVLRALDERASLPPVRGRDEDDVFVARESELDAVRAAITRSSICIVRGEPGMGKTTLAQHALRAARRDGALVLAGRCHPSEALPYKAFDTIADALVEHLPRCLPRLRAQDVAALAHVFPQLQCTPKSAVPAPLDPRDTRMRAFSSFAALLGTLSEQQPIVLFIDDAQWGDADGAALLAHLLTGPVRARLSFIACVRAGESGPYVAALDAETSTCPRPRLELDLAPLDGDACARLARRVARAALATSELDRLQRESGGNPLLLRALLGSETTSQPLAFAELVAERLARLPAHARDVLALAAVAGRPVSVPLLGRAMGAVDRAWPSVAALRNQRLLRTVTERDEVRVVPHHDRVREVLLARLSAARKRSLHARLARAGVELDLDDVEFLAEQHYCADQLPEAARYAELAGDRARSVMALQRATDLYARALECLAPERPVKLILRLAEAATSVGDLKTAAPLFVEAAGVERGAEAAALQLRAAEMYLLAGAEERGLELLRPALRSAGIPLPDSRLGLALAGACSLLRATFARRRRRVTDVPHVIDALDDARVETSFRVGYMLSALDPARGLALLSWSAARGLREGSRAQQGRALAQLAHVLGILKLSAARETDAMLREALALTEGHALTRSHVLLSSSLVHFTRLECRAAMNDLDAATELIARERVDSLGFVGHIHSLVASMCVMTGDFTRLDTFVADAERRALEYGNPSAASQLRSARAWRALAAGRPSEMLRYASENRRLWASQRHSPLYALGIWGEGHGLLYAGNGLAAAQLMAAEAPRLTRSAVGHAAPWQNSLQLLWASIALSRSRQPNDRWARAASRYASRLERHPARVARAYAALIRGGLARRERHYESAIEHYARARADLERAGLHGHAAAAAYRAVELRGTERPEREVPWFATQSIAEPDRWTRMFAP